MRRHRRADCRSSRISGAAPGRHVLGTFGVIIGVAFASLGTAAAQGDGGSVPISLADAVGIAIVRNTGLRNEALNRINQRLQLRVAESEFWPKLALGGSAVAGRTGSQQTADGSTLSRQNGTFGETLTFAPELTLNFPTGGDLAVTWNTSTTRNDGSKRSFRSAARFQVTQPLLQGAGFSIATSGLRRQRIQERVNVLALESQVIATINAVIAQYRGYQQALQSIEIARQSVAQTERQFEVNAALIQAGRMAVRDNVQTEQSIAAQQVNVVAAENSADQQRLELLNTLNLPGDLPLDPIEPLAIEQLTVPEGRALDIAFANRTDWQQALLQVKLAEIQLLVGENGRLPQLDLAAGVASAASGFDLGQTLGALFEGKPAWNVSLTFSVPTLGDLSPFQAEVGARVALMQALNAVDALRTQIRALVYNAIRGVRLQWQQYELAQRARELAEEQLAIEREKLRFGRSTNFQVLSFQTTLTTSRNSELNAIISYQNALTNLDSVLGTTLETWGIRLTP